jgi:hypothetical protein
MTIDVFCIPGAAIAKGPYPHEREPPITPKPQAVSRWPIADVLGQVYEQFLGKVIRLTAGHQAKVEEKPEVRKAGGVYYTPTYIVDYIVRNTVGKLVEGKTPTGGASIAAPRRSAFRTI